MISGTQKGRILKSRPGKNTRPTTDKVKESLFNIIGPYFNGGYGLDLFAGSGALGIEGISRGLDKVVFVDNDYKSIQTVKENIAICNFNSNAEVYKNDWKRALRAIIRRGLSFRVIWIDPPYKKHVYETILQEISENHLLTDDGVVVCEHEKEYELPAQVGQFVKMRVEHYGTISISFYEKS